LIGLKEQASRPDDSLDDGLPRAARGRLRNILGNLGWLLGGKGFGAVCSLIYLSILARSLGLRDFGHFSLIFGAAQAVVAIAGFQTWQSVIRFGSKHLKAGKAREFRRLALFCSLLDALGAPTGCLLAAIIFYGFAGALNLNPNFVDMSLMFDGTLFAR
jgi:O-antigen/teichoic acid export membrane protein